MRKTTDIAADRAYDESKTVLPAEYARGVYMRNAPSLQALKLMHYMIAKAKGRMADDIQHQAKLSELRNIEGINHHTKASLIPLFEELRTAILTHDDFNAKKITIGGLLDESIIDYQDETSGDLVIKWYFGRTFRTMAANSNHWAILDRQTVFSLKSKYSVLLFQHIASLINLSHIQSKTFTISDLRMVMGVANGKLSRFANLNARAIQPAIEEINQLSRFTLKVTPHKTGRTVTSVEISWFEKRDLTPIKRELDSHKTGRKARRNGTVETVITDGFPKEGSISYSKWGTIARQELPTPARDIDLVANEFRSWCLSKNISIDGKSIEKTFRTFCKNQPPIN